MHIADLPIDLPGIQDIPGALADVTRRFTGLAGCSVDHVALCVEAGNFSRYVARAQQHLPAARSREYQIGEPDSGMRIAEVHDRDAGIHIVLSAPTGSRGQLAEFLARTGGEGLQHIAFALPDVGAAVAGLAAQGLHFVGGAEHPERAVVEVREGDRWLRQAFTQPVSGEFFLEVIERNGITEMRPENIRALYQLNDAPGSRPSRGSAPAQPPAPTAAAG